MRAWVLCVMLFCLSSVLLADERSVVFDPAVDFSLFKTFALREAGVESRFPELKVPAFLQSVGESIRLALTARGLKQQPAPSDVIVEYRVRSVDYFVGPYGRLRQAAAEPTGNRQPARSDFTVAMLVVDIKRVDSDALVWRGVYYDMEHEGSM